MATASLCWVMPRGARYSSARISPGWMGALVGVGLMGISSVVVDDLDIVRPAGPPAKADPPLLVDPDAVLAGSVTDKLLEPISRRDSQVSERFGGVEDQQLAQRRPLGGLVESSHRLAAPDPFGVLVSEGTQHTPSITCHVITEQRYVRLNAPSWRPRPRGREVGGGGSERLDAQTFFPWAGRGSAD